MAGNVVAIMPIKLVNARLPGKNIAPLGGIPLVHYVASTMAACREAGIVDECYVFCSDPAIRTYTDGLMQFLRRPASLDADSARSNDILASFAERVYADVYVLVHATSPFTRIETVRSCVDAVRTQGYDSAFTAREIMRFVWFGGKPVNFDPSSIPRTQDLVPAYEETSGVISFRREVLTTHGRRTGFSPCIVPVSGGELIDIDEASDFVLAERYLAENQDIRNTVEHRLTQT